MSRPDLATMWALAFDNEKMRLQPTARYAVLEEFRCARRAQHLQAVVIRSAWGRWVAWRSIIGARDVWSQSWLDELMDEIEVTCHCDRKRRVDLSALRAMH